MFSSDNNIETIGRLFVELKRYVELKGKCMQIDFVGKLSQLMAALVLASILFVLGGIAMVFISMMTAAAIAPYVGGTACSYAIIVGFHVALAFLVYTKRRSWIEAPIINFLGHLFLDDNAAATSETNLSHTDNPNRTAQ